MTYASELPDKVSTPTGQPGRLIECHCGTNHGTGRAIVLASWLKLTATKIHGHVLLANHPALSRAPQIRRNEPWAV